MNEKHLLIPRKEHRRPPQNTKYVTSVQKTCQKLFKTISFVSERTNCRGTKFSDGKLANRNFCDSSSAIYHTPPATLSTTLKVPPKTFFISRLNLPFNRHAQVVKSVDEKTKWQTCCLLACHSKGFKPIYDPYFIIREKNILCFVIWAFLGHMGPLIA